MGNVLASLLEASHELHPDDLPRLVASQLRTLGGHDAVIYLSDLDQRTLVPLPGGPVSDPPVLAVDGTLPGRSFRSVAVLSTDEQAGRRLWLPLLDGGERVGLLAVTVAEEDPATVAGFERIADLVAQLVVTKSQFGDELALARRKRDVNLAAELRWALLPPLTCSADTVTIAGVLEPAYEIAGDAFDYSVTGDTAHVAIVDAMGHGLESSRIANLAVCAYRNSRRRGLGMEPTFRIMDQAVAEQFGQERFLTGQLAQLSLSAGSLRLLNAGHPRPILLRGSRDLGELACEPCLPIGLGEVTTEVAQVSLEPGDSVLFFTDGVTDARSPEGEAFGRQRLGDLLSRAASSGEPPPEIMRRLSHAVIEHAGLGLRDDATLLMVRWSGPRGGSGLQSGG
ncbi:MAG: serine/threonine-protein phosphatase [Actinobacteria bacterium]|nr:serine/threonine-protein phosphatase [Actinomycetota bacterium]